MKKIFWLVKDGKRTGPHRMEEMQAKIADGEVAANDLVFYPGSKGLEKIGNLEDFDFDGKAAPAPSGEGGSQEAKTIQRPLRRSEREQSAEPEETPRPASSPSPSPSPSPAPATSPAPAPAAPAEEPVEATGSRPVQKSPPPPKPRLPQPHPRSEEELEKEREQQRRPSTRILSRRELEKESSRLEQELDRVRQNQAQAQAQAPAPGPSRAAETSENKQTTPLSPSLSRQPDRPTPFKKKPAPPTKLSGGITPRPAENGARTDSPDIEIDYSFAEEAAREEEEHQQRGATSSSPPPPPAPAPPPTKELKPRAGAQAGTGGDIYGMQTVVINAPNRKPRPRRNEPVEREAGDKEADRQYPEVIKAALRSAVEEDEETAIQERPSEELLPEARNMRLREGMEQRKPKNRIKPEFENSLGIGFVAVEGLPLGVAIWPVRVKDYRAFISESQFDGGDKWRNPDFLQLGDNPVTYVSYEDASAFCLWLTQKERQDGWIDNQQIYRLPTDSEWSIAAGLKEIGTKSPALLDGKVTDHYPWGTEWPPPPGSGNYSDESADRKFGWGMIHKGYDDGYVYTSPVGTFMPNKNRLFDIGGNVWEWVSDWYDEGGTTRALRGGSWTTTQREHCLTSARDADPPEARRGKNGFRIVLAAE